MNKNAILLSLIVGLSTNVLTAQGSTPIMLTGVPDVHQAEYYSCGAASFQAILAYYGISAYEVDLRTMLNCDNAHGTYSWDMVHVAQHLGFDAEWKQNLTLDDIRVSLQQCVPVIIRAQHYTSRTSTWENTWGIGHYMVVFGMDDQNVYLEDPYILGARLELTRDDFVASWHSYDCPLPIPDNAQKHFHEAVFIRGTPPAQRPDFVGITNNLQTLPPAVLSWIHLASVMDAGGFKVTFLSTASLHYTLYYRTNPTSGSWLNVPSQTDVAGSEGMTSLRDPSCDSSQRFYRVGARLP
jgi:uncharacterized protein